MNVTSLADRAVDFVMSRLGLLPTVVGVRSHPAPVVLLALSERLVGFFAEGEEGPFVAVVAAGREGNTVVLGKVADSDALERALVDHPGLDTDEVSWVLADLAAVKVAAG